MLGSIPQLVRRTSRGKAGARGLPAARDRSGASVAKTRAGLSRTRARVATARESQGQQLSERGPDDHTRGYLELQRLALAGGERAQRRLERLAREAMREPRGSFGPRLERLFDLVAESDLLREVAPGGRVRGDFAARCLDSALRGKKALRAERAALAIGAGLAREANRSGTHTGPPAGSARLGTEGGGRVAAVARLARFARDYPGEPEEGTGPGEIAVPGTALAVRRDGTLVERDLIPGTSIVVGGAGRGAAHRAFLARAAARLGRALAIVDAAWPEAGREIRKRTRLVIPRSEPGLVSYSLPSRPGVSFINLKGKRLIDLADDLLHETAHHALHAIERKGPLVPLRPALGPGGEELRYWSPWRRAQRPVRGILHAWYTFAFRAELFARLIRGSKESRRSRPGLGSAGRRTAPRTGRSQSAPRDRKRAPAPAVPPAPVRARPLPAPLLRELTREARKERRFLAQARLSLLEAARLGALTRAGRSLVGRVRGGISAELQ